MKANYSREKPPIVLTSKEEALSKGYLLGDQGVYPDQNTLCSDWRFRAHTAFLVLPHSRGIQGYPLIHWGTELKSVGVNPASDMSTQTY
ncbi:MAG: hypothetical protein JW727_03325 [Candidatus Aenigmarchaeota archaeon]|nr:hypothetical protein [Candidatus Aenigmarchaeota archaeon]